MRRGKQSRREIFGKSIVLDAVDNNAAFFCAKFSKNQTKIYISLIPE